MRFERCDWLDGDTIVIDRPLSANSYEDLVVLDHGLYHLNGYLLRSSGVYRGDHTKGLLHNVGGSEMQPRSMLDDRCVQPPANYVWLGLFQTHFGHFLVGALSRLWAWSRYGHRDAKLVYVGEKDPDALFAIPYVAFCLSALGIERHHLHRARHGDHFPRIRVPDPAFIENHSIAPEYRDVARAIRGYSRQQHDPIDGLVYLSKQNLVGGVRGIVNEADFAECLRSYGATVICPEELDFSRQIALWLGMTGTVVGFAGSAFHVAMFASGKNLCTIAPHHWASSNQILLDRLSGNRTVTAQAFDMIEVEPAVPRFQELLRIVDPQRMADLFMAFVETEMGDARLPGGSEPT